MYHDKNRIYSPQRSEDTGIRGGKFVNKIYLTLKKPMHVVTALYEARAGYGEQLLRNFKDLLGLIPSHISVTVWTDGCYGDEAEFPANVTVRRANLDAFEAYRLSNHEHACLPANRSHDKDTKPFMGLMNAKVEMIFRAAELDNDSTTTHYVWLDCGISKIWSRARDKAKQNLLHVFSRKDLPSDRMVVPGCWTMQPHVSVDAVCWRFCGGFFIVPAPMTRVIAASMINIQSALLLSHGISTWEVNVWAIAELEHPEWFEWFHADHDERIVDTSAVQVPLRG